MSDENKNINIVLDAETEELLKDTASLSGMSLEQFCLAAARAKADLTVLLYGEKPEDTREIPKWAKDRWLPILELQESANDPDDPSRERKVVWEVNSEGMVRWGVKNTREESLKALDRIAALREKLFQGRVSSTNSVDLIREAREERHRDMEALGNLFAECDAITQGRISVTDSADLIREAREERHQDMEENGGA